eukprot:s2930_g4.t1
MSTRGLHVSQDQMYMDVLWLRRFRERFTAACITHCVLGRDASGRARPMCPLQNGYSEMYQFPKDGEKVDGAEEANKEDTKEKEAASPPQPQPDGMPEMQQEPGMQAQSGMQQLESQYAAATARHDNAAATDGRRHVNVTFHGQAELLDCSCCSCPRHEPKRALASEKGQIAKLHLWALGTLVYELLVGHPPFWGSTEDIRQKVLAVDLRYPPNLLSQEAIVVFRGLLQRDPRRRTPARELLEESLWVRRAFEPRTPAEGTNLGVFRCLVSF